MICFILCLLSFIFGFFVCACLKVGGKDEDR